MEKTLVVSPISIVEPGMAVASLSSEVKDRLFNSSTAKLAIGREVKEDDFLYFAFKLVHIGKNNNKDIFLMDELKKMVNKRKGVQMPAWKTPVGEPIDYDHNFGFPAIVGDIYDAILVEKPSDGDVPHIKAAGVIYRGLYPDVAFKVARGSELGYAKVSMEVRFDRAVTTHEGRVLYGLNFKGAALTRMPADVDADITSVDEETLSAAASELPATREIAVGSTKIVVPSNFVKP